MKAYLFFKEPKYIIMLLVAGIIIISATGCYNDKEEILYPQSVCDTIDVTYSRSIVPIVSANCNSCHGGNTPSAGIKLDTYASVKLQADNGKLWGAVSQAANFSPMPKNGTKLSTCILAKIKLWLDAGALNN